MPPLYQTMIYLYTLELPKLELTHNPDYLSKGEFPQLYTMRKEIGRSLLKYVIEKHLNKKIDREAIKLKAKGKPYIDNNLSFNLSYSANKLVLVLNETGNIGVDIEIIRKSFDYKLTRIFSRRFMLPLSNIEFYILWTKFESVLKADGNGISSLGYHPEVINDGKYMMNGTNYFLKTLYLFNNSTVCTIALDDEIKDINIQDITIEELPE